MDIKSSKEPWLWQPRLRSWVNVNDEWWAWWSWQAMWQYFLANAWVITVWTDTTFSWFGFTPKKVMIQWWWNVWIWYFDINWNKRDFSTNTYWNWTTSDLIYLENATGKITWVLKEFNSDWFVVTWTQVDAGVIMDFYMTCYSNL